MLKKIKHLKGDQLHLLTSMANTDIDAILAGEDNPKEYKYKELLYDSAQPENINVEFLVENIIDQLMFDNYNIYLKMKARVDEVDDLGDLDFPEPGMKEMFEESNKVVKRFIKLYERLLLDSKFEYPNIRQVQKYLLKQEMEKQIRLENYEICSEIKRKIEEV